MYNFDIKEKIIGENKKKIMGKIVIMIVFLAMTTLFTLSGNLLSPFYVIKTNSDEELMKEYDKHKKYVSFESLELEFTGYYKTNKAGNVVYNCYATSFDKIKYFVFVPAKRSSLGQEEPEMTLKDYSFVAKIQKDEDLFQVISEDYNIETNQFSEQLGISNLIFNEAKSDRNDMLALWFLFFLILIIGIVYIINLVIHVGDIEKTKAVEALSRYGDISKVIESINQEMQNSKVFDSNYISITHNWFMSFYEGNIVIINIKNIELVEEQSIIKKAYGLIPIGKALFIKLNTRDGQSYKISIETSMESKEIIEVVKDLMNL